MSKKEEKLTISSYRAEWATSCQVCGQKPTVHGLDKQKDVIFMSGLCGACLFGEADMADYTKWDSRGIYAVDIT